MKVRVIDHDVLSIDEAKSEWQSLVKKRDRYSFFQTPQWSQWLAETLVASEAQLVAIHFLGGVKAFLPLFSTPKRLGLRKLESLPWGAYGGMLSADPLTAAHYQAARLAIGRLTTPVIEMTLNPLDLPAGFHSLPHIPRTTHILELGESFERLWHSFQPRTRTAIRRAEDEGVTVRQTSHAEGVKILYKLYQEASQHWQAGVERVPQRFFEAMARNPCPQAVVWIADQKGKPVAADLMLYGKGEVQYMLGASRRTEGKGSAPRLLISKVIEDACQRNIQYLNFGGSAGLEGVERFKTLFAAQEWPYVTLRWCGLHIR